MGNRIGWIMLGTGISLALAGLFALPWYATEIGSFGHPGPNHSLSCAALAGTGCAVSDSNAWFILVLTVLALVLAVGRAVRPRYGALWCVGIGLAGIGIGYAGLTADYDNFSLAPASPGALAPPDVPGTWNPGSGLFVSAGAAALLVVAALLWLFADGEPRRRALVAAREPRTFGARVALGGSLIALVGSFLPWENVAAVGGGLLVAVDTPAPVASALSVGAVLVAVAYLRRDRRAWAGVLAIVTTMIASIAAEQSVEVTRSVEGWSATPGAASVAPGMYVFLAGSLIAALAAAVLLTLEFEPSSLSRAVALGSILVVVVGVVISVGAVRVASRPQSCRSGGVIGVKANGQTFSGCFTAIYGSK